MLDVLARRSWMQVMLVVLVGAAVYLPFLGGRPLDFSEGHRAVPAWTMLESHDFWHQKMFGLTYIRKPPGMAWAIAASSAWLGETPLAARLPSAIAAIVMGVIAWWYGRRWFGGPGQRLAGISAALAQVLMPLMWSPGRTAEIEMLNNLGTQMFALGLVDLLVRIAPRGDSGSWETESPFGFVLELVEGVSRVLIPSAGLVVAALAKGPASVMVLGGVLAGSCIAARSVRPLASRGMWIAMVFGASAIVVVGLKFLIANDQPDAVREDVAGQFLWPGSRIEGVLALLPVAWVSAMPTALALLVPLGASNARADRETRLAWALAWAWVISVGALVCAGVSNPRYAMPAAAVLPPLVPFAIASLRPRLAKLRAEGEGLTVIARRWAASPLVWACAMAMAAWWFIALTAIVPTDDQRAGESAAQELGAKILHWELWADDAIEARPDIVWALRRWHPALVVRWAKPAWQRGQSAPDGTTLLLRMDSKSDEVARYLQAGGSLKLPPKAIVRVRTYEFALFDAGDSASPKRP